MKKISLKVGKVNSAGFYTDMTAPARIAQLMVFVLHKEK